MVSMKDVAQACGVSVATVSKALNDHSDIGKETRDRVKEVARQMNYFPNSSARTLKTKRSYNLGILLMDLEFNGLRHERFANVLDAFKVIAEEKGYDLTFISNQKNMTFYEHARYRGVDGVLIACVDFKMPEVLELVYSSLPVVTIDYVFDNCIGVVSDNVQGMKQLCEYAVSKGHKKIAYVHGSGTPGVPDVPSDLSQESTVTKSRLTSFYCTMEENDINIPSYYIRPIRYRSSEQAYRVTEELLKREDRPTCIFYSDDKAAAGGIKAILKEGLRVPEDVSVAGYDGSSIAALLSPDLTTVDQNDALVGQTAAQLLIRCIEEPHKVLMEKNVIPSKLIEGSSICELKNENNHH